MRVDPHERILFRGHPCWRSMAGFYVRWLALAIFAGVVAGVFTVQAKHVQVRWVALAVFGAFGLALLRGLLRRAATTYTLTDRRLVVEHGLLGRDRQEAPLHRIQNVFAHQTLRQRLMGVGTVHFDTAAGAEYDFCFWGVERPRELMAAVDHALGDARRAAWDDWEPVRAYG